MDPIKSNNGNETNLSSQSDLIQETNENEPPTSIITITEPPQDVVAEVGDTISFSVTATDVVSYQWQISRDNGISWYNGGGTGCRTNTYPINVIETTYSRLYRCYMVGTDNSEMFTIPVRVLRNFEIVTQPQNVEAEIGDAIEFTVEATGVQSYQWQISNNNGFSWYNAGGTGCRTNTYPITVIATTYTRLYRCHLVGENGTELDTTPVRVTKSETFEIVTQPQDVEAEVGDAVSFTVEATGVKSYQWEISNNNGASWYNAGGAGCKTATFPVTVAENTYIRQYRCHLIGMDDTELYTTPARVTRSEVFEIVTQPQNVEAEIGDTVSFTVEATGVKSYQWEISNNNGASWYNAGGTGCKTATFPLTVAENTYIRQYRCHLIGKDDTELYTTPARVTRSEVFEIVTQPQNVEAEIGDTVSFTVEATGVKSYQWEISNNNGASWYNAGGTGCKTATFPLTVAENTYIRQYRCHLIGKDDTELYTTPARVTRSEVFEIVTQPQNVEAEIGDTVSFTVEATGVKSYQWEISNNNGASWYNAGGTGCKTATFPLTVAENTYIRQYRCHLIGKDDTELYTTPARVTRSEVFEIVTQPQNVEAEIGDTVSFTVEATGVKSYQWEISNNNGASWYNAGGTGCKTATFPLTVAENTYIRQYRCHLIGKDDTELYTTPARVTRSEVFEIVTQPQDVEAEIGDAVSFTVEATGVKSYQWEISNNNGASWYNAGGTGCKTATFPLTVAENTYIRQYRCHLIGKDDTELYTTPARVTRSEVFEIVTQPQDVEAEIGDAVSFTVEATGVKSYQWEISNNNGASWYNAGGTGCKTATFPLTVAENTYIRQYRCHLIGKDDTELYTTPARVIRPVTFEIVTEPQDVVADVGDTVSFTVEATGVVSYQWQVRDEDEDTWSSAVEVGNDTDTLQVTVAEASFSKLYRCHLIGADNTELNTASVRVLKDTIVLNDVTYEKLSGNGLSISSYAGSASSLVIPETIEHNGVVYTVKEVGEGAFENNTVLESITLPDTIEIIKARAFKNCSNLREMN